MSSGGNEPVSDSGKEGNSVFAWNFVSALNAITEGWSKGSDIYQQIYTSVSKELPQSPQYGTALSAGHEIGADYIFEKRQLLDTAPATPSKS